MDATISALYDLKRQGILLARLNPVTAGAIDDALAHAYNVRICPVQHDRYTATEIVDPFKGAYDVEYDFARAVLDFCDKEWLAGRTVTFRALERKFSDRAGDTRMALVGILRYAFLRPSFDDKFFQGLQSDAPSEAHGIDATFRLDEISVG